MDQRPALEAQIFAGGNPQDIGVLESRIALDLSIPMDRDGKRGGFNYFFCKGCGICAAVCPFGAIEMIPEEK